MLYAHVEKGSITFRGPLPKTWRNISGLNLSEGDDDYLKTLGWLPYVEVSVQIGVDETSDGEDTVITETEVTSTAKKRALTAAEKTDRNDRAFAELRTKRDQLLHDTDWWASSDLEITQDQIDYRQALRDLPANTADPADPIWPTTP
jgi:hypothetical protein